MKTIKQTNSRRAFLTTTTALSLATIGGIAMASQPKQLSTPAVILIAQIDKWKLATNAKIRFYDDPTMHRQYKYGVYGWYEGGDTPNGIESTSLDWKIGELEDSNLVLKEIVEHYEGRITEIYDGNQCGTGIPYDGREWAKLKYQEKGYIRGIEV